MIDFLIDGVSVSADENESIVKAAERHGITIPVLCGASEYRDCASCMICAVYDRCYERFLPACSSVSKAGMDLESCSERVIDYRRTVLELMLGEHAGDCLAPCRRVCPARFDIPSLLEGKQVQGTPPCETCPAPCEKACRQKLLSGSSVAIRKFVMSHASPGEVLPPDQGYSHTLKIDVKKLKESPPPADANGCLHCQCAATDTCQLRKLASALKPDRKRFEGKFSRENTIFSGGMLFYEPGKCILCGRCTGHFEEQKNPAALCLSGRGVRMRVSNPLTLSMTECLSRCDEAVTKICPTGALHL